MLDEKTIPLELDTVSEFKRNRAETWAAAKLWLLIMAVGAVGGFFANGWLFTGSWALRVVLLILFGASIIRLTFIFHAHYRCPACGEIPMSGWASLGPNSFGYERGVDLEPHLCPNCGVKLK